MHGKYGSYSSTQISSIKSQLRKSIFFLLLYVDPKTRHEYPNIDVVAAFRSLQLKLNGLNRILLEPPELVETMILLESALEEYEKDDNVFNFQLYRKLVLDAGSEVMKIKEEGD